MKIKGEHVKAPLEEVTVLGEPLVRAVLVLSYTAKEAYLGGSKV